MSVFENSVMVEQKKTPMRLALELVVLVAAILVTVGSLLFNPVFLIIGILLFFAFYFVHKYNFIEYEYIYIEGQLDIDRIYAKSRRKSVAKIDMEDLIMIAPAGSREISNYERNNEVKKKNCTSCLPDRKIYDAVYKDKKGTYLIYFEPDENMLDLIAVRNPRKIVK